MPTWRARALWRAIDLGAVLVLLAFAIRMIGELRGRETAAANSDFTQYYLAARLVLEGHSAYRGLIERAAAAGAALWIDGAPYPPLFQTLILPLAALPHVQAWWLWQVFSCLCLLVTMVLAWPSLGPRNLPPAAVLVVAAGAVLAAPFQYQLLLGQVSAQLLLLLAVTWRLYRAGRWGAAGIILGLACAIKLFTAPLILYFLWQRNWRAVCGAGFGFVVFTLLGAFPLGLNEVIVYYRDVMPTLNQYYAGIANFSLFGLVGKTLALNSVNETLGLTAANRALLQNAVPIVLSASALLWAVGHCSRTPSLGARADIELTAVVPAVLLASPIAWPHYLLLMYLPIMVWLRAIFDDGERRGAVLRLALLAFTLMAAPNSTVGQTAAILAPIAGASVLIGDLLTVAVCSLGTAGLAFGLWLGTRLLRRQQSERRPALSLA